MSSIITITYWQTSYSVLKQYRIFGILFLTIKCPQNLIEKVKL
jgi:hypothetical protein